MKSLDEEVNIINRYPTHGMADVALLEKLISRLMGINSGVFPGSVVNIGALALSTL